MKYRLYASGNKGYEAATKSDSIRDIIDTLDILILGDCEDYDKYLVIKNENNSDSVEALFHRDQKERYSKYRNNFIRSESKPKIKTKK